MVEFVIQVPLTHNDGSPVSANIFKGLQELLIDEYGGTQSFREFTKEDGKQKTEKHTGTAVTATK